MPEIYSLKTIEVVKVGKSAEEVVGSSHLNQEVSSEYPARENKKTHPYLGTDNDPHLPRSFDLIDLNNRRKPSVLDLKDNTFVNLFSVVGGFLQEGRVRDLLDRPLFRELK